MRVLLVLLFSVVSFQAQSADSPSCSTPRAAAMTLFGWLQPDSYDSGKAASCLVAPPGKQAEAERYAIQLKSVLDARGLFVRMEDLPDTSDVPLGEGDAAPIFLLHPDLPHVSIQRVGEEWKIPDSVSGMIPALYQETFSDISMAFQGVLPTWFMKPLIGGFQIWQVLYAFCAVFLGMGLGFLVNRLLRNRAHRLFEGLGYRMDPTSFDGMRKPMCILASALVLWMAVPDLHFGVRSAQSLLFLVKTLVSLEVVIVGIRVVGVFGDLAAQRAERTEGRMDDQLVPIMVRTAKIVVAALGIVFVLQNMGVDVGSLVAGLGIGGLAFALAAKDALANVFGSLTIFTDRPFQVGDAVEMGGVWGTVEEVGLRSTRIRTLHNSLVTVPNSTVATSQIDNLGKRPYRRTRATLGILYGTPPELIQAFVEGVRAILANNPATVKDSYEVNLNEFGPSSLDILVNFHLLVEGWHGEMTERARIYMEILRLAEELGVGFAFPSSSLYLEGTPERPFSAQYATDPAHLRAIVESFGPGGTRARPDGPVISDGFEAS